MIVSVSVLKEIFDKVPGDFEVKYKDGDFLHPVSDVIEIDVSGKMIILKSR